MKKKNNINSDITSVVLGYFKQFPQKGFSSHFIKWVERLDRCISLKARTFKKLHDFLIHLFSAVKIFLDFL